MPLLDHFRPPLSEYRHWHSFHNSWATAISSQLNALLPDGYFAEANVQFGIEIDVAAFDAPPPPAASYPVEYPESLVEVRVFGRLGGPELAGAVELVSPANKDRPAHRVALANKCAAYLQAGVGLALVDVVTERSAQLNSTAICSPG